MSAKEELIALLTSMTKEQLDKFFSHETVKAILQKGDNKHEC